MPGNIWLAALCLTSWLLSADCLRLDAKRVDTIVRRGGSKLISSSDNPDENLQEVGNTAMSRYTTNVTIDGQSYTVIIDTGSTDLWIKPDKSPSNSTDINLVLGYGGGDVSGTIAVNDVKFGNYEVPRQAYMAASKVGVGGFENLGLDGLMGLSFDTKIASPIGNKIKEAYGDSENWGQSFLANVFDQDPKRPNYLAVSLSRTEDQEHTADSSFYISEVDPDYSAVQSSPRIERVQTSYDRWSVLVDGISVNGKSVQLKSRIRGVPSGKIVTFLDTGDPNLGLSPDILNAIFSQISGAVPIKDGKWMMPCDANPLIEVTLGGQTFPINPIDLTSPASDQKDGSLIYCLSNTYGPVPYDDVDSVLGDVFLRNVYSLFDFGDTDKNGKPTSNPFVQLLSQTDGAQAVQDLPSIRAKTAPVNARLPVQQYASYLKSLASSQGAEAGEASGAASGSDNNDDSSTGGMDNKYGMIVIGLLAGNLLVGVILVVMALAFYIRKGKSVSRGSGNSRYKALSLKDTDTDYHD